MPWQRSRRIGGRPSVIPTHLVEHEQRVEDFLHKEATRRRAQKKKAQAKQNRGKVHFRKLPTGAWGIAGPRRLLIPGATVSVTTRSGSVSNVVVGAIVVTVGKFSKATIAAQCVEDAPMRRPRVHTTAPIFSSNPPPPRLITARSADK